MLHVAWKVVGYDDKESMDKIKDVSVKIENDDPKEVARQIVNQTDVERRGGPMMTETLCTDQDTSSGYMYRNMNSQWAMLQQQALLQQQQMMP